MSLKTLAAGLAAATVLLGAVTVQAADLDIYGKQAGPYDDPRYADIYGQQPGPYAPPPQGYAQQPPPPAYSPPPPGYRPYADATPGCMPRHMIRAQLEREGWTDFHAVEPRDSFVVMHARRPNGEVYRLRLDRCTGAIASARPVAPAPQPAPYGYGPGPGPAYGYGPYADGPRSRWRRFY